MTMSSGSKRHHYIPCFYTKQWMDRHEEKLREFSRKGSLVKPRRTTPRGTGYVELLYTVPHVAADQAQVVEDVFFKRLDQQASDALDLMLAGRITALTPSMRIAWCLFINSLVNRHPQKIAWLKQTWMAGIRQEIEAFRPSWDRLWLPGYPLTYDDFITRFDTRWIEQQAARGIEQVVDSKIVCEAIDGFLWATYTMPPGSIEFLTSDRPVIMSDGLTHEKSHIAMPISPTMLFVGAKSADSLKLLRGMKSRALVAVVNDRVARQAHDYVYGRDETQLRFIENRLGRQPSQMLGVPDDILEALAAERPAFPKTRALRDVLTQDLEEDTADP